MLCSVWLFRSLTRPFVPLRLFLFLGCLATSSHSWCLDWVSSVTTNTIAECAKIHGDEDWNESVLLGTDSV